MSTQRHSRRRHAALATGVIIALALATPLAGASAATPVKTHGAVAVGPTFIATTFNGPTQFVVSAGRRP
jgi:uncharacterized membrane protein